MGLLTDRLRALTAQMKESDAKMQRLIDNHLETSNHYLEELKKLNK
jgi:hypothetical protein